MSEWISVKDRLPDHGAGVIVVFINHDPASYYEHNSFARNAREN